MRQVVAWIALSILLAGTPRISEAQVWDNIPLKERAQAINAALNMRFGRVPDGIYINRGPVE